MTIHFSFHHISAGKGDEIQLAGLNIYSLPQYFIHNTGTQYSLCSLLIVPLSSWSSFTSLIYTLFSLKSLRSACTFERPISNVSPVIVVDLVTGYNLSL